MGRGKLPMELIASEKARNSTFNKRKKGLKKKLYEFTTLCGVDACMIVYGPHQDDCPMELDIWPSNPSEVHRIIGKYKSKGAEEKAKRIHDLSNFFEDRKQKINDDIVKMRRANMKAKFPGWDSRIDCASIPELQNILYKIEDKINCARICSEMLKETQRSMIKNDASNMIGLPDIQSITQSNPMISNVQGGLYQMNMQGITNPFECYMPQHYTFDQSLHQRSVEFNSWSNPVSSTMMTNDEYLYGSSSNTSNIQYATTSNPSIYHNQTFGLCENTMYNNNIDPMTLYYSLPNTQQQVHQQIMQQHQRITNNNISFMTPNGPMDENYLGVQEKQLDLWY